MRHWKKRITRNVSLLLGDRREQKMEKEKLKEDWEGNFGEPQRTGTFTRIYRDACVKPKVGKLHKEKEEKEEEE